MQDVYATTFALAREGGGDVLDVAAERITEWLGRRISEAVDFEHIGEGEARGPDDAVVRYARRVSPDGSEETLEAFLEHPDERVPHDRWRAAVVVSRSGGSCRATIRVSRGTTRHELRPRPMKVSPPGIVGALLKRPLHGYAGPLQLRATPDRLHHDDVAEYVADYIGNPGRVLPVVVCDTGATSPLDPKDFAYSIATLAHVAVLGSVEAWERLKTELPGSYVPYGGARVYWPGFGATSDDARHWYFTRADLAERPIGTRLARQLRDLAVRQVPRDRLPDRLRIRAVLAAQPVSKPHGEAPRPERQSV